MPITRTQGYADSSGVVHGTLEAAQQAEMVKLLGMTDGTSSAYIPADKSDECLGLMAADLIRSRDALLAILTTGPRTRPKARKAAGTTNPRRAAKRATVPANGDQPHDLAAPRG